MGIDAGEQLGFLAPDNLVEPALGTRRGEQAAVGVERKVVDHVRRVPVGVPRARRIDAEHGRVPATRRGGRRHAHRHRGRRRRQGDGDRRRLARTRCGLVAASDRGDEEFAASTGHDRAHFGQAGIEDHRRAIRRVESVDTARRLGAREHATIRGGREADDVCGRRTIQRAARAVRIHAVNHGGGAGADPELPLAVNGERPDVLLFRIEERPRGARAVDDVDATVGRGRKVGSRARHRDGEHRALVRGGGRFFRLSRPEPEEAAVPAGPRPDRAVGAGRQAPDLRWRRRQSGCELRAERYNAVEPDQHPAGRAAQKVCRCRHCPESRAGSGGDDPRRDGDQQSERRAGPRALEGTVGSPGTELEFAL